MYFKSTDPKKGKAVLKASRKFLKTRKVQAVYEHGQWWVWDLRNDNNYSVNDSEGMEGIYTFDGFCFEQI